MDIRPVICLCLWVVLAAVSAESSPQDKINGYGDDPSSLDDVTLEGILANYDEPSKRGTMLRYGRGTIFRFGKRPSTFRYGKRGTIFRFGKRDEDDASSYDDATAEKRGMLFRYGKRMDETVKRGSLLRYGKRFARDTKRQKVHKPFRFGRELEEDEV